MHAVKIDTIPVHWDAPYAGIKNIQVLKVAVYRRLIKYLGSLYRAVVLTINSVSHIWLRAYFCAINLRKRITCGV